MSQGAYPAWASGYLPALLPRECYRILLGCYIRLLGCESDCEIGQNWHNNGESLTRRRKPRGEQREPGAGALGRDDASIRLEQRNAWEIMCKPTHVTRRSVHSAIHASGEIVKFRFERISC